ncbi:MAG: hypothetical protein DRJ10_00260 [Bacteroidetes bacterium]|nr:MAG: hypothetical protein DRJ10_00260 [Bacteroidota bacterium]
MTQLTTKLSHIRISTAILLIAAFYSSVFDSTYNKAVSYKNINSDSVLHHANQALTLAKESNNPLLEYKSLILLAKSNIKTGHLGEAIVNCSQAGKLVESNNLSSRKVEVLMYLGVAYQAAGFTADAIKLFLEARTQVTEPVKYSIRIDLDYYIGLAYAEIQEYDKSYYYLQKCIKLSRKYEYNTGAFDAYILLSNTSNKIETINKNLELANIIINENPQLKYERVVLRNNQALLNKALGKLELSRKQYLEAIRIAEKSGYREMLSSLYNNYSYLQLTETKYDSAKIYLDKSLELAKDIESLYLESEIYDSYGDYYKAIGAFESALKYSELFTKKRNQYREQQRIQETLFLSAIFETEQKEKELLQQENEISKLWLLVLAVAIFLVVAIGVGVYFRQRLHLSRLRHKTAEKETELKVAEALIHGRDAERKRLAMDLHDGMGARLGALRFLVDGFFKSNEKYKDVIESIKNIRNNVRELSHRMMPAKLEDEGLVSTINSMVSGMNDSEKFNVSFDTNLDKRLSPKLESNIYFLILELINNAIKHSNGNTIFVQLLDHSNNLSLQVEDNGGGFNQKESTNGIGLKNIKTRIEYLGGKLNIESDDSQTQFMIEIPKGK